MEFLSPVYFQRGVDFVTPHLTNARALIKPVESEILSHSKTLLDWAHPNCPLPANKNLPFMDIREAVIAAAAYISFVVVFGFFMRFVAPKFFLKVFEVILKPVMNLYNLVQVVLCGWMFYAAITEAQEKKYNIIGNKFDTSASRMAFIVWVFYVSKVLDFLDTVFIILRGKWAQLSFLHVYHHMTIFLIYWLNANVGYDGDIYLTVVLNSFIHLVMYSYYLLTGLGIPCPWKKLVTLSQLIQFVTMMTQAGYLLYFQVGQFPRNVLILYFFYILSLFILFMQFYIRSYSTKKGDRAGKPHRTSSKGASSSTPAKGSSSTPAKGSAAASTPAKGAAPAAATTPASAKAKKSKKDN